MAGARRQAAPCEQDYRAKALEMYPSIEATRPPMTPLADDADRDLLGAFSDTQFDGARLATR